METRASISLGEKQTWETSNWFWAPLRSWTPGYLFSYIWVTIYTIIHPDHPWLTKLANSILASYLKNSDIGLEFGSGRSTIWFAERVKLLVSVEHNPIWHRRVEDVLKKRHIDNVVQILIEKNERCSEGDRLFRYLHTIKAIPDDSLDFVLVDGIYRGPCAVGVLVKIRPGGILILDNVNCALPCKSSSPNSRSLDEGPASQVWTDFLEKVKNWRRIWTSSGVTDTAIYFKPPVDLYSVRNPKLPN